MEEAIQVKAQRLGWEEQRLPTTRYFVTADIVYIGGEMPEVMAQSADQASKEAWFRMMLELHLPALLCTPDAMPLYDLQQHPIALTSFQITLHQAPARTFKRVKSQRGIDTNLCALGDACLSPHFLTRSGVNSGFQVLKIFERAFSRAIDAEQASREVVRVQQHLSAKAHGSGDGAFKDARGLCPHDKF